MSLAVYMKDLDALRICRAFECALNFFRCIAKKNILIELDLERTQAILTNKLLKESLKL